MRVTFPASRTSAIITLGRHERPLWGTTATADGRLVADTRRAVQARVRKLFAAGVSRVEVYAPAEAGGCMIDQHLASD